MAARKSKLKDFHDLTVKTGFSKGSVLRVKLINFLTYDDVEFRPGPNLNLIIGANGTGKSSIVCALVLGMAGRTSVLGRAKDPFDYIKHGENTAVIELELYMPDEENCVVKRVISRQQKTNTWYLNNTRCTMKAVEELAEQLNIQVGNLCQFLPQEKVDEFAKMNSVELLESTEKTVGGLEMYRLHERLKSGRDDSRALEEELENFRQQLETEEGRNKALEGDVKSMQKHQQYVKKIKLLQMKKAWVEYKTSHAEYKEAVSKKQQTTAELKKAREANQPLRDRIEQIKEELAGIDQSLQDMSKERKKVAKEAAGVKDKIQANNDEIDDIRQRFEQRRMEAGDRERELRQLEEQLQLLEQELAAVDNTGIHEQLAQVSTDMRSVSLELTRVGHLEERVRAEHSELIASIKNVEVELKQLQDVNNQRLAILRAHNRDAYNAVLWLRENSDQLQARVHEPIMTLINVKDPAHTRYVESHIGYRDQMAFVCESPADQELLLVKLREEQKLRINVVCMPDQPADSFQPELPIDNYHKFGFFSYLRELFTCPEPVMRYLCQMYHVHRVPVGNRRTKEVAGEVISCCQDLRIFYTEFHRYRVTKSRYSGETSSACAEIREPNILTKTFDSVRDQQLRQELADKEGALSDLETKKREAWDRHKQLDSQLNVLRNSKKSLVERRELERTLSQKVKGRREQLEARRSDTIDLDAEAVNVERQVAKINANTLQALKASQTGAMTKLADVDRTKMELSLRKVELVRTGNAIEEEFLEKNRLAASIELELSKIKETVTSLKEKTQESMTALKKVTNTKDKENISPQLEQTLEEVEEKTLDEIERAIVDLGARASLCEGIASGDNVLVEFEKRKQRIAQLESSLEEKQQELDKHRESLADVRARWEVPVREMVDRINENFRKLFAELSYAGQVSLHVPENPENYGQYGIKIQVKYRHSEPLRDLMAHVQSGGERSVATVVYMMALQEMTSCPFRCVDEINQGMDPTNERKVFELVVKISCQEHTSQYFLLTPKLLPNLAYSKEMTVLCVFNGPETIKQSDWDVVKFLDRRQALT